MNKIVDELKKESLETKEMRAITEKIFEALQAYNGIDSIPQTKEH